MVHTCLVLWLFIYDKSQVVKKKLKRPISHINRQWFCRFFPSHLYKMQYIYTRCKLSPNIFIIILDDIAFTYHLARFFHEGGQFDVPRKTISLSPLLGSFMLFVMTLHLNRKGSIKFKSICFPSSRINRRGAPSNSSHGVLGRCWLARIPD